MSFVNIIPKDKRPFVILIIIGFAITLRYISNNGDNIYVDYDFINLGINSKINIHGYNHGLPLVSTLEHSKAKPFILPLPMGCSAYARTGDSLIKSKGVNSLKVVRDSSKFRVTTTWSSFQNPSLSQLTSRSINEIH